ncbi:MAG: selenium metabolism-associated LysR family transcriptional regulator [Bacillota bacterium]|nr:selenium metabolism-associated LysR family transcriptional regulator [Bacillota bacterium]MDD3297601.1 selenium metabolism-associated LysR family transcriptional regulator [Bacillota bacterium]MDD3851222.1 selenium metabolism-associated LysR family transcriptional regulator [Bacillota bacterium]MDD4707452.1 selenium metabolism-associated LysR family transcriptional regulator [Bacillota bacterium]
MDLRQLESFVAIAKHGSFTRAAEELYLTQPTLTGHIQSIENELGTVLLNRCGKSVTLTEAGRILYSHAVNILNMREQALFSLAQYEGKLEGELAIASSTVPQGYLLPGLLSTFGREYPGITYVIKQFDSRGVVDAIISGSMDFGFVGSAASYPELEMLKICEDRLILITSGKGKFQNLKGDTVTWGQVSNERFILREEGSGTRALFINGLKQRGMDIKNIFVVASIENPDTIKQCVREGLGVAVVSERSVEEEIRLGLLKGYYISDLDLRRSFYFIGHKNRVLSPVARAFRDFTVKYCQGL